MDKSKNTDDKLKEYKHKYDITSLYIQGFIDTLKDKKHISIKEVCSEFKKMLKDVSNTLYGENKK